MATEAEIKQTQDLIRSQLSPKSISTPRQGYGTARIWTLVFTVIISYAATLWSLVQPITNLTIFAFAFCVAAICSLLLGIHVSRRK